jgi:ActR/RegA family two-component response regulator
MAEKVPVAMKKPKVLLVDDNVVTLQAFKEGLESCGFDVVAASAVHAALGLIASEKFDVLLSDLHIPEAGDGFAVLHAMRRANPEAITLVLSGYPALQEAISAILMQADEILGKPLGISEIAEIINRRLLTPKSSLPTAKESVASILERELHSTIRAWMELVSKDEELKCVPLNFEDRAGHLPRLLQDLIARLRQTPGLSPLKSVAAGRHGRLRQQQGYTVPMVVEESRILQVSIFKTIHENMRNVDFTHVMRDVVTIADEVDSQLKEQMVQFMESSIAVQAELAKV